MTYFQNPNGGTIQHVLFLMGCAYLSGATRSMPIGVRVVVARVGIAVVVVDVRRGQWVVVLYQV